MNIISVSFLVFISFVFKVLSGLVINKVIALTLGPSGLAYIGKFQNLLQLCLNLSKGGINSGVVKLISQQTDRGNKRVNEHVYFASLFLTLFYTIIISGLCIIFSEHISSYLFETDSYSPIILILAITLPFFSTNQLYLSYLTAKNRVRDFISIGIAQNLFSLFYSTVLVYQFKLPGALLALATNQAVVFVFVAINNKTLVAKKFKKGFFIKKAIFRTLCFRLSKFSLMSIVSMILAPVSIFILRQMLIEMEDIKMAGYWQGTYFISSMFLLFISKFLSLYYLPYISKLKKIQINDKKLMQTVGFTVLLSLSYVFILVVFDELIISLLFDSSFMRMKDLFIYQGIGDLFKVLAIILSYIIMVNEKTKLFFFSELFVSFSLISISYVAIAHFGFVGISIAHMINGFFSVLLMIYMLVKTDSIMQFK